MTFGPIFPGLHKTYLGRDAPPRMKPSGNSTVQLRRLQPSDAATLHHGAFGVPKVSRYLQWGTHKNLEETQSLVTEMMALHERGEKFFWVAVCAVTKRTAGLGSLRPAGETAWVGLLVLHEEQRMGYGSAILSALEATALQDFECASAEVDPRNQASIDLLLSSGWVERNHGKEAALSRYEKRRL